MSKLRKYLLSTTIRMVQQRSGGLWSLEFAFGGNPVGRINKSGHGGRSTINLTFEVVNDVAVTVERILKEWVQMVSQNPTFNYKTLQSAIHLI